MVDAVSGLSDLTDMTTISAPLRALF